MTNTNLKNSFSTEEIKQISLKIKEDIFKPTNTYANDANDANG
jgi:hypothetical protein